MRPECILAERGALAGLVVTIARTASRLFEKARTRKSLGSSESIIPAIELEVCFLYAHLLDRTAFSSLPKEQRLVANDNLREALAHEFSPKDCDEIYRKLLALELENSDYAKFSELLPALDTWPGNTLFWELGKRVGFKYEGYNAIALQVFVLAVIDGYTKIIETVDELSKLGT